MTTPSPKVVNSVSAGVSFFQLKRNVSISERFGVPFRGVSACHFGVVLFIYIYIILKKLSMKKKDILHIYI
jgi:hypothetical protein